jgi:class 3 adenylate cyclase
MAWIEDQVEHVEAALGEVGARARPERVPAMCFLDLAGYTRLTEERGDQAAAALVESLAVLVRRLAGEHGRVSARWLGDGVMFYFREPAGAVLAALQMWRNFRRPAYRRRTRGWRPGRWWSRAGITSAAP